MKSLCPLVFAAVALLSASAQAQVSSAAPAAPAAAKPAPKLVPLMRVAYINSGLFVDEASGGIKQLIKSGKQLELEFSGQQSDLSLLNEKLRTIVTELKKLQAGGTANNDAIQAKQTEGLKLQQELQEKQQAFQAAVQQAQQDKQGPIIAELDKAMTTFAKERQIGIIFDMAKVGNMVVAGDPELDVTADFIAYFNASHP